MCAQKLIEELVKTEAGMDILSCYFSSTEWRLIQGSFDLAVKEKYIPKKWQAPLLQKMKEIFTERDGQRRYALMLEDLGTRYCAWLQVYSREIMAVLHSAPHEIVVQSEWITAWETVWKMTEEELEALRQKIRDELKRLQEE